MKIITLMLATAITTSSLAGNGPVGVLKTIRMSETPGMPDQQYMTRIHNLYTKGLGYISGLNAMSFISPIISSKEILSLQLTSPLLERVLIRT